MATAGEVRVPVVPDFTPLVNAVARFGVVGAVIAERAAQDEKWSQQDHPLLPSNGFTWITRGDYLAEAEAWKRRNDYRFEHGQLGWDGILLEEVFEALGESDPLKQETELIQVAAVAVAAVEALRRKRRAKAAQAAA